MHMKEEFYKIAGNTNNNRLLQNVTLAESQNDTHSFVLQVFLM